MKAPSLENQKKKQQKQHRAQNDMEAMIESFNDIDILTIPFWSDIVVMLECRLKYIIITLVVAKAIGSINNLLTIFGTPCPSWYLFYWRQSINS